MRKSEKETVIRWDSEARIVSIDGHHVSVWRKLDRAGYTPVRATTLAGRAVHRRYELPLERFRFRVIPKDRPRRPAPPTAFRAKTRGKKPRG